MGGRFLLVLLIAAPAQRQEMDAPRPIAGIESVWLEELTWMEVRGRIAEGSTTAIISTGGIDASIGMAEGISLGPPEGSNEGKSVGETVGSPVSSSSSGSGLSSLRNR